jgi:hypothetical protein
LDNQIKLVGKIDLCFNIVVLTGLFIDLVWKSFTISLWYADMLISLVVLFQLLVLNYEAKQILSLTLVGDAGNYKNTTLGGLTSLHPKALGQHTNSQETTHRVRSGGYRNAQPDPGN